MPEAAKSAVAGSIYDGDIHSHLVAINPDSVGKATMFTADEKFVVLDEHSQAKLTLDFTCYGCHKDPAGVGGDRDDMFSLGELSLKARGIHE